MSIGSSDATSNCLRYTISMPQVTPDETICPRCGAGKDEDEAECPACSELGLLRRTDRPDGAQFVVTVLREWADRIESYGNDVEWSVNLVSAPETETVDGFGRTYERVVAECYTLTFRYPSRETLEEFWAKRTD